MWGACAAISRSSVDVPSLAMTPGIAPWSRKCLVSRLVSTSERATTPFSSSQSLSPPWDRQFEGRLVADRTINPEQRGRVACSSAVAIP